MKKRILITGGAGFLGSHLCERLLERGDEVLCVDNYFTGRRQNIEHLLQNPRFEAIIENWLRVLRKKNAVLWFATQSLSELAGSEISAAIINSIPTKIFLPNEEVRSDLNYDLYTRSFGLNDAQVEQIQRGVRKRNYLMYQGSISRMVWAQFDPTILACLRSDGRAQKVFQHWFERRDQDAQWKRRYIEEICDES